MLFTEVCKTRNPAFFHTSQDVNARARVMYMQEVYKYPSVILRVVHTMQTVHIPEERLKKLRQNKELVSKIERLCKCSISIDAGDSLIEIKGGAYEEYSAKNIIYAFGRGFEMEIACKLSNMDYYFSSISLDEALSSEKRIKQVKARIIGESGRTKTYIEQVSGAKISVYGDTVSFIGSDRRNK